MEKIRSEIDAVDQEMAKLFEKRMDLVYQVAEYKFINNGKIFDPQREEVLIEKNITLVQNEKYQDLYVEFLHMLMDQSKEVQRKYIEERSN